MFVAVAVAGLGRVVGGTIIMHPRTASAGADPSFGGEFLRGW